MKDEVTEAQRKGRQKIAAKKEGVLIELQKLESIMEKLKPLKATAIQTQ
ncbi:unnamed protein product, partial [Rotaria sp. Silwood2]